MRQLNPQATPEQQIAIQHRGLSPVTHRATGVSDQFDEEHVFGVTYLDEADGHLSYRVVWAIEKVRPAAVPIDQPPTFDMEIVEPIEHFEDKLRLTIEEIEHVRAAEPSDDR